MAGKRVRVEEFSGRETLTSGYEERKTISDILDALLNAQKNVRPGPEEDEGHDDWWLVRRRSRTPQELPRVAVGLIATVSFD